MRRRDLDLVRDILECIEAIDRAAALEARYQDDPEVAPVSRDAIQHNVFTIGEAVRALSADVRDDHPAVAWSELERLGDLAGRPGGKPDPHIVRATAGEPFRGLRAGCRAILAESVRVGEDEP